MYLGNVTINPSSAVSQSIIGNFISSNRLDLIIVKGSSKLELIHIEDSTPIKYDGYTISGKRHFGAPLAIERTKDDMNKV